MMSPGGDDQVFGFQPFCCVQQLKEGKPWIGFIFICEVETGEAPKAQLSESKDAHWAKASEVQAKIATTPDAFLHWNCRPGNTTSLKRWSLSLWM
jgi:hypothetical protein